MAYAPELEWILAAVWAHYPYHEFRRLDGDEQSRIIAAYRAQLLIEAAVAWANRPKPPKGKGGAKS